MPPSIAAAKAGVTTGEWGPGLREVFGEYRAPTGIGAEHSVDTERLKQVRELVEQVSGKLGRTLNKWSDKICNYHIARVNNGPTEALNNLIKRIKRIGFGFRNFGNYRVRALLYAGKPNWRVLGSIVVQ